MTCHIATYTVLANNHGQRWSKDAQSHDRMTDIRLVKGKDYNYVCDYCNTTTGFRLVVRM